METKNAELMRQESRLSSQLSDRGVWEVVVGKEKFRLTGKQVNVIKEADRAGMRGMVWFDNFAISIPHIQSVTFVQFKEDNAYNAYLDPFSDVYSGMKIDEAEKKVEELKLKFIRGDKEGKTS